jgi:hypothetical protein
MALEESFPVPGDGDTPRQPFPLGQDVFDKAGKKLGNVGARFSRYILVEHGSIFVKAYYVPHSAVSSRADNRICLSLSENELRHQGYHRVLDDLYIEPPDLERPDITGVVQFIRGPRPLSPAETGHYHYGRRCPGMNTDASGSYRREEVFPQPQRVGRENIFTTDLPLPPREVSPDEPAALLRRGD